MRSGARKPSLLISFAMAWLTTMRTPSLAFQTRRTFYLSSQRRTNSDISTGEPFSALSSAVQEEEELPGWTPWNNPRMPERMASKRASKNKNRCRQHVNPLASQFQKPTILPEQWPHSDFVDPFKPLHIDIGCGKGRFLLDFAAHTASLDESLATRTHPYNHLGLEIRPPVVELAKSRLGSFKGHVDFIGCNVNVDLERILSLYPGPLQLVTIQFPDPHFKSQHAKRRVVRPELVECIAKRLQAGGSVFLQSDIQSVLDDMRLRFADASEYFSDCHPDEYMADNPLGVPTEREVSVLERDLPVYRAMFQRTNVIVTDRTVDHDARLP